MTMVVYGSHVFPKFVGYFGEKVLCPNCHKTYKPAYVKNSVWGHIYYIPLIPLKTYYNKICPVCGYGDMLKKKDAMVEMAKPTDDSRQEFQYYAKHILANKSTKMLQADTSYEIYAKDLVSGEETCILAGVPKGRVKGVKKMFGLKENISITDV